MGCCAMPLPVRVGSVVGGVHPCLLEGDSIGPFAGTSAAVKSGSTFISGYMSCPPMPAAEPALPALAPLGSPASPPLLAPPLLVPPESVPLLPGAPLRPAPDTPPELGLGVLPPIPAAEAPALGMGPPADPVGSAGLDEPQPSKASPQLAAANTAQRHDRPRGSLTVADVRTIGLTPECIAIQLPGQVRGQTLEVSRLRPKLPNRG